MCGAFSIRLNPSQADFLQDVQAIKPWPPHQSRTIGVGAWHPIYNARPGEMLPIVTEEKPKTITSAWWGFLPHWMDPTKGRAVINARGETITEKPYFRSAMKQQRCIIPADGFYEWKATTKGKIPHFFHRRDDKPFAFAGLYDARPGKTDALGFAIITTTPNSLVAKVHDRMPVMLADDAVEDWLNPDTTADRAAKLLKPYPAKLMTSYVVSRAVNFARNKGPEVMERLR